MRHKKPSSNHFVVFCVVPSTCIWPANSLRGKELVLVVTGIISNEVLYSCMAPCICIRKCHRKLLVPQGVHTLGAEVSNFAFALQPLLSQRVVGSWINYLSIGNTSQMSLRYNELTFVLPGTVFYCLNKTSTKLCNMHKTVGKSCCPRGYDLQPLTP